MFARDKCEVAEDEQYKREYLNGFADFCSGICAYIEHKVDNRQLQEPIIRMILSFLRLNHPKCVGLAGSLMNKHNYFTFKNNIDQFMEIFDIVIDYVFYMVENDMDELTDDYVRSIKACSNSLSNLFQNFQQEKIQTKLFNKLIKKSVSENIENLKFYEATEKFFDALDFQHFSAKSSDINELKEVVKIASSQANLETLQPDLHPFYYTRNLFYTKFFRSIANIYKSRPDLVNCLEPEILDLLVKIDGFRAYDEPGTSNNELGINFLHYIRFLLRFISKRGY